jgi:hypothetical protein
MQAQPSKDCKNTHWISARSKELSDKSPASDNSQQPSRNCKNLELPSESFQKSVPQSGSFLDDELTKRELLAELLTKPEEQTSTTLGCTALPQAPADLRDGFPPPVNVAGISAYWVDSSEHASAACQYLLADADREGYVAVDCEGVKLSKQGELCLVSVATQSRVFVFDICALGTSAFDAGLQELLTKPHLRKVFQDARQDADALYWQFGIDVTPIWDAQVADVIHRRLMGQHTEFVSGLPKLLSKHCPDHPAAARIIQSKKATNVEVNENPDLWRQRPLQPYLFEYAVLDVLTLPPLRKQLIAALAQCATCAEEAEQLDQNVLAMSGAYAACFKNVPYVCNGPAYARFPHGLFYEMSLFAGGS